MIERFLDSGVYLQVLFIFSATPLIFLLSSRIFRRGGVDSGRADYFAPQYAIAASVFIGTTLRAFYLLFHPDPENRMISLVGNNLPEDIMAGGLIAINLGVLGWAIGYFFLPKRNLPIARELALDGRRFRTAMAVVALAGTGLMLLYLQKIDFLHNLSSYGISGKRIFASGSNPSSTTVYGHLRIGGDLLFVATILQLSYYYLHSRTRQTAALFWLLFCLAVFIPFIASARGDILYLVIACGIVRHYLVKRVSKKVIVSFVVAAFFLLGFMGVLRVDAYRGDRGPVGLTVVDSTFRTLVYNAQWIGVGKTSVIVSEIPGNHDYQYGLTYPTALIAPIPKAIWPGKPVVRVGRFVGQSLFRKLSLSGVPPGMIGEAYINFGWFGVLLVPLVFGRVCRNVYGRFALNRRRKDVVSVTGYAIFWILIINFATADFTGTTMKAFKYGIPFLFVIWFSRIPLAAHPRPRRRVGHA